MKTKADFLRYDLRLLELIDFFGTYQGFFGCFIRICLFNIDVLYLN